jgi:hypothetical protein
VNGLYNRGCRAAWRTCCHFHTTNYFELALLSEFACVKDNSALVARSRCSLSVYNLCNMPTYGIDVCDQSVLDTIRLETFKVRYISNVKSTRQLGSWFPRHLSRSLRKSQTQNERPIEEIIRLSSALATLLTGSTRSGRAISLNHPRATTGQREVGLSPCLKVLIG